MYILLIPTFSCKFEEFKTDISLFITTRVKKYFQKYYLVNLESINLIYLYNLDNKTLDAELISDVKKRVGLKIITTIPSVQLSFLNNMKRQSLLISLLTFFLVQPIF